MLAIKDGFQSFDPNSDVLSKLRDPEAHLPGNHFNEGKCDEGLSAHAAPNDIEFKDKLQKTRSGKIMWRVLKAW
jgi:acyl-CoA synthetase (AMP-forming)/AMP-acid ligase II